MIRISEDGAGNGWCGEAFGAGHVFGHTDGFELESDMMWSTKKRDPRLEAAQGPQLE
jgi:hypothetical protein